MGDKPNHSLTLNLDIVPNSNKFEVVGLNKHTQRIKIKVKSPPESGKANAELEKELSKLLETKVKILTGKKSKRKTIVVKNQKHDTIQTLLAASL